MNYTINVPISLFPLDKYDQNIYNWVDTNNTNHNKTILPSSYQKKRLKEFYTHYFSTDENSFSPWSEYYFHKTIKTEQHLETLKHELNKFIDNSRESQHVGYGENFRPYKKEWYERIYKNMDLDQLSQSIKFNALNRAILVQNTSARSLPTQDAYFYSFELPGEGYPFDNLQQSALWVGTPIYILSTTLDGQWSFVITPDLVGWIPSEASATVNARFIKTWQECSLSGLAAITETQTSIIDMDNNKYRFTTYVGTVFPVLEELNKTLNVLIPVKDKLGNACIRYASLNKKQAALMPLSTTPKNFLKIINTLHQRPYGWGGCYFYNDCSAELKSLFTPFGIWLPRHSSDQVSAGKMIDKSLDSPKSRIQYLTHHGRPWTTLVYIDKHIFLYIGNHSNSRNGQKSLIPVTYQNIWALKPIDQSRRAVIGQAVIFPLLENYPEDHELNSLANYPFFKIVHLDEWPDK